MHWLVFGVSILGFAGAVFAKTPGLLGLGLAVGFVSLFVAFFLMVSARVAERSRPDATLLTDADVNALRKRVREARDAAKSPIAPQRKN